MQRTQRADWKSILLAVVILVIFGVLVYYLFSSILSLDAEVAAAIIAAVATVLVSVFSIILQRRSERRKELEQHIREQKTPLYEKFMLMAVRQALTESKASPKLTEDELLDFFREWFPKVMIWGSDPVILELALWRRFNAQNVDKENPVATLQGFARLFLAMRADLGHDNKGVTQYELLSLFVNDIDKYAGHFQ